MRSLLLLLLFISSPVYAIVVTGEGFSFEDAKQQAFKKVIEKEVGVIVDSERIVVEKDLVSSKILTYSAGFITSYNVLEHTPMGEMHYVKLDVTVASSKLKDFILLQPFDILDYDGSQIKEMIDSFKQQAIDADTLVNNFLKYYPHEAYLVTTDEYVVKTDPYRNAYIEIPYQIKWNDEFINSFAEIAGYVGSRTTILGSPILLFAKHSTYYFYDRITFANIKKVFDKNEYIRISVINAKNEPLLNTCVQSIKYNGITGTSMDGHLMMYGGGGNNLVIQNNKKVSNIARIELTDDVANLLTSQVKIKIDVSSIDNCYG